MFKSTILVVFPLAFKLSCAAKSHCLSATITTAAVADKKVVKTVHFVRHAQGFHNVAGAEDPIFGYFDKKHTDAKLTDLGYTQCKQLANKVTSTSFDKHEIHKAQILFVSPMHRTLQTATHCFPHLIVHEKRTKIPFVAVENIREQSGLHPCDNRFNIDVHQQHYQHVDFRLIDSNEDPIFKLYFLREPRAKVAERAHDFLHFLKSTPESNMIVVTHSAFLRTMFNQLLHCDEDDKIGYKNCELRSYSITFDNGKISAKRIEA